jgi:cell division protein FtsW
MLGVVMVFSASYPRGLEGFDDPFYFVMRQLPGWHRHLIGAYCDRAHALHLLDRWSIPLMAGGAAGAAGP